MIRALLSQSKGVAVADHDGQLWLVEAHRPDEQVEITDLQAQQVLRGARDVEALDFENQAALALAVQLRGQRERLLQAVLILIDATRSDALRDLAAASIRERWTPSLWRWIEGVLLSVQHPAGTDFQDAAVRIGPPWFLTFLGLQELQPAVRSVQRAWHVKQARLPARDRDTLRAEWARTGRFRVEVAGEASRQRSKRDRNQARSGTRTDSGTRTERRPVAHGQRIRVTYRTIGGRRSFDGVVTKIVGDRITIATDETSGHRSFSLRGRALVRVQLLTETSEGHRILRNIPLPAKPRQQAKRQGSRRVVRARRKTKRG